MAVASIRWAPSRNSSVSTSFAATDGNVTLVVVRSCMVEYSLGFGF